jgi:hypothetical protein
MTPFYECGLTSHQRIIKETTTDTVTPAFMPVCIPVREGNRMFSSTINAAIMTANAIIIVEGFKMSLSTYIRTHQDLYEQVKQGAGTHENYCRLPQE